MNALFFSKVYPRFSKLDIYKCPFFKKGLRELKFSYIITLSASALPILRGYLYDLIVCQMVGHVATIMVRNRKYGYFGCIYGRYSKHPFFVEVYFSTNNFAKFGSYFAKMAADYCYPFLQTSVKIAKILATK